MTQLPIVNRQQGSKPVVTVYDTSEVSTDKRLAHCNSAICSVLSPTETYPMKSGSTFSSYLRNIAFGPVGVTEYRTSGIRDIRSARMIKSNPDDDFFVLRMTSGIGILSQRQHEAKVRPGEVVLYDSAKEFIWEFESSASMQIARIPRAALLKRISHAENLVAKNIPLSNPFNSMLGHVLDGALSISEFPTDFDVVRYGGSITEMLGTCLELGLESAHPAPRTDSLLTRAKKVLTSNLDNPDFDFSTLARSMNASPRTICRAFASEGTTAIRWLWSKRLELAYELATGGTLLSVSQIALRCGFSDFAHFSRTFKKAFGTPPSSLLTQSRENSILPV